MVSRDTTVHISAVTLAILVAVALQLLRIGVGDGTMSILVFLLVYGLVFGGAHFYLALRGEDGMVPVAARWRYVATILVLLGTGAVSLEYGTETIGPVEGNTIALVVAVLALVVYLVTENISAYRTSMSE